MDKNQEMYELIIIGGGVAGLFLAANLPDQKILLLDHAPSVGRKLLITGGGQANITNDLEPKELLSHFPTKEMQHFLAPALQSFTPQALITWFEERLVPLTIRSDGHVFPSTLRARTILDALVREIKTPIYSNTTIEAIYTEGEIFHITTAEGSYHSKRLVLATGGMSYPTTGSDGSGYSLAKSLGHSITPPKPALVHLVTAEDTATLSGITLSDISFTAQKQHLKGDILFTHKGLSGPGILNCSRIIEKGDTITLHLLAPSVEERFLTSPKKQLDTIIGAEGIPNALAIELCRRANLDPTRKAGTLRKDERKGLLRSLSSMEFTITSTGGFTQAMVTSGGVYLNEVNRKTMESRITPNLFFCGEILDYDGPSGGYNIQAAMSTAYLIAQVLGGR